MVIDNIKFLGINKCLLLHTQFPLDLETMQILYYGAPDSMTMDGSKAQTSRSSAFMARLRRNKVMPIVANPYQPNMNPCEVAIQKLRKKWCRAFFHTNYPRALWGYGLPHFAQIMQLMATRAADLKGQTPSGVLLGETPDISQYLDFGWYDWGWYKENNGLSLSKLGKFLGIADSASYILSYCILPESYIPIVAGTVQRMTYLERQTDANEEKIKSFNNKILYKLKEERLAVDGDVPKLDQWDKLLEIDANLQKNFINYLIILMFQKRMKTLIPIHMITILTWS